MVVPACTSQKDNLTQYASILKSWSRIYMHLVSLGNIWDIWVVAPLVIGLFHSSWAAKLPRTNKSTIAELRAEVMHVFQMDASQLQGVLFHWTNLWGKSCVQFSLCIAAIFDFVSAVAGHTVTTDVGVLFSIRACLRCCPDGTLRNARPKDCVSCEREAPVISPSKRLNQGSGEIATVTFFNSRIGLPLTPDQPEAECVREKIFLHDPDIRALLLGTI